MKMFTLAFLTAIFAVNAHADCSRFTGEYVAELECQGLSPHSGVEIQFTPADDHLVLTYDLPSKHPMPAQNYIADGSQHLGDSVNSGDTYSAACTGDVLKIRRVFSGFKWPIVEEITLRANGLDYIETYEGRDGATGCRFDRR